MSDTETTWIEKLVGLRDRLGREAEARVLLSNHRRHTG